MPSIYGSNFPTGGRYQITMTGLLPVMVTGMPDNLAAI